MKKEHRYNIEEKNGLIKITVDELPHLVIKREELISIQSFVNCTLFTWCWVRKKYCIEFTFKGGEIENCEYRYKGMWIEVLKLLNTVL